MLIRKSTKIAGREMVQNEPSRGNSHLYDMNLSNLDQAVNPCGLTGLFVSRQDSGFDHLLFPSYWSFSSYNLYRLKKWLLLVTDQARFCFCSIQYKC